MINASVLLNRSVYTTKISIILLSPVVLLYKSQLQVATLYIQCKKLNSNKSFTFKIIEFSIRLPSIPKRMALWVVKWQA